MISLITGRPSVASSKVARGTEGEGASRRLHGIGYPAAHEVHSFVGSVAGNTLSGINAPG